MAIRPNELDDVPLFQTLPDDARGKFATWVSEVSVPAGKHLAEEGEYAYDLFVIKDGKAEVIQDGSTVAELGPGEFFGEMGLIDDEPRSASVVTIEPCELLAIAKRDFKKCLMDNNEMCMAVMRGLVKRLREADRKIGSLALLDVYGRVARLLLDMAENVNGEKVVTKRLPKQDIAKMIGASREMVSRVMKDLQTGGYIEMRGSNIVLRDTIMLPE